MRFNTRHLAGRLLLALLLVVVLRWAIVKVKTRRAHRRRMATLRHQSAMARERAERQRMFIAKYGKAMVDAAGIAARKK